MPIAAYQLSSPFDSDNSSTTYSVYFFPESYVLSRSTSDRDIMKNLKLEVRDDFVTCNGIYVSYPKPTQ